MENETIQATVRSSDESAGLSIGPYKLLEKIGEGGFGEVWLAEQKEPVRRRVAVKIIKLGMDTRQVVARFEAERQALALMDHPNIAKVLDAGATELGRPYFVMEHVKGVPITDYCRTQKLDTTARLHLFIQICRAIQHAHQKGIIHRDIKPSNILVAMQDGLPVPKVIDFGIAKATQMELTEKTIHTQLNQFIGTPAYMSPEQAEMTSLDIDTRSDIYSLGVLLYELLTGTTPFDTRELLSAGLDEMRRIIREREPLRPSTRLSQIIAADAKPPGAASPSSSSAPKESALDPDLDWIVLKCLEKDRTRRYETVNGLALDAERYLNNEVVLARPPSVSYRFQKWASRHRLETFAGSAILLSLVCGLALAVWGLRRERQARSNESAQRVLAEENGRKALSNERRMRRVLYASQINLAQQALELSNFGRARELLDQARPRPGEEDLRGWEWRYVWKQCQPSPHQTLARFASPIFKVALSPDATLAAVLLGEKSLEIWDVPNRKQVKRFPISPFSRHALAWSPDGLRVGIAGAEELILYDTTTWQPTTVSKKEGSLSFAFSPDSSAIAHTYLSDDGLFLEVFNSATGALESSAELPGDTVFGHHFLPIGFAPDGQSIALGGGKGTILFWNKTSGIRKIGGGTSDAISHFAFLAGGLKIAAASGYTESSIRIWDVSTGSLERILTGHNGWIPFVQLSSDGKTLYSACADQTIRAWDTATWNSSRLAGHSDEVLSLAVLPDGQTLLSGAKNGEFFLWNSTQNTPARADSPPFTPMTLIRGSLASFDPNTSLPGQPLLDLGTNLVTAARNQKRQLIATLSESGEVSVRHAASLELVARFQAFKSERIEFCGLAGDLLFIQQGRSGGAVYDLAGKQLRSYPPAPDEKSMSIEFAFPVHNRFVRGTRAGRWEILSPDGSSAAVLDLGRFATGIAVAEHPHKPWIGIASDSGFAWVVDLLQPRVLHEMRGGFHSIEFSPDGTRLATFSGGREALKMWDLETGQELLTLPGPGTVYRDTGFSEDGNEIFGTPMGNYANRVRWRAPSWAEIGEPPPSAVRNL